MTADVDTGAVLGLNLQGRDINDVLLRRLGELPELRTLSLRRTQITAQSLARLRHWPKLESVVLAGRQFTDRWLEEVAALPNLKTLRLTDTKVTAEGLAKLRRTLPGVHVVVEPLFIGPNAVYLP